MMENGVRMPALRTEEAVLLPALSRHLGGSAALKAALRKAETAGKRTTGDAVSAARLGEPARAPAVQTAAPQPASCPCSRAALHHALKK